MTGSEDKKKEEKKKQVPVNSGQEKEWREVAKRQKRSSAPTLWNPSPPDEFVTLDTSFLRKRKLHTAQLPAKLRRQFYHLVQ